MASPSQGIPSDQMNEVTDETSEAVVPDPIVKSEESIAGPPELKDEPADQEEEKQEKEEVSVEQKPSNIELNTDDIPSAEQDSSVEKKVDTELFEAGDIAPEEAVKGEIADDATEEKIKEVVNESQEQLKIEDVVEKETPEVKEETVEKEVSQIMEEAAEKEAFEVKEDVIKQETSDARQEVGVNEDSDIKEEAVEKEDSGIKEENVEKEASQIMDEAAEKEEFEIKEDVAEQEKSDAQEEAGVNEASDVTEEASDFKDEVVDEPMEEVVEQESLKNVKGEEMNESPMDVTESQLPLDLSTQTRSDLPDDGSSTKEETMEVDEAEPTFAVPALPVKQEVVDPALVRIKRDVNLAITTYQKFFTEQNIAHKISQPNISKYVREVLLQKLNASTVHIDGYRVRIEMARTIEDFQALLAEIQQQNRKARQSAEMNALLGNPYY